MDIKNFIVGQTVYIRLVGNASRGKSGDSLIEEWEIISIGRKLIKAKRKGWSDYSAVTFKKKECGWNDRFIEKTDTCVNYVMFVDRKALINQLKEENIPFNADINEIINIQPIAFDTEKVVEQLEEKTDFLKDCTKYGNKNAEQQEKSYSTMMMYEVADLVEDLIDIVKKGGVE